MESAYYPPGSNTEDAPWNKKELPEREIEVTVSVSLSKTVKIKVNDYEANIEADEDGLYVDYDFSKCNLYSAVCKQIQLPKDKADGWSVDEIEVTRE